MHSLSREVATDLLSAVKWLKKGQKNTIHVFEDRNVSELQTNGNSLLFEKCAVLYEYLLQKQGT